jgi:hypothetical protein
MFFSFYMYVFILQKLNQREHKRFEVQPSNPAHLGHYVVTGILYVGIQVVVGFFAVHPRAVGDSLEKSVIILFTKWLNQLTDTAIQHPDPAFSDTREYEGWQTKQ